MTYEEAYNKIEEMRSRYDSGFTSQDFNVLDKLYYSIYQKSVVRRGCQNCYKDAYILIRASLKKSTTMPSESNYILKAGALIREFGASECYVGAVSDEVAENYLRKYPSQIKLFQKFPSDWEERISIKATAKRKRRTKSEE